VLTHIVDRSAGTRALDVFFFFFLALKIWLGDGVVNVYHKQPAGPSRSVTGHTFAAAVTYIPTVQCTFDLFVPRVKCINYIIPCATHRRITRLRVRPSGRGFRTLAPISSEIRFTTCQLYLNAIWFVLFTMRCTYVIHITAYVRNRCTADDPHWHAAFIRIFNSFQKRIQTQIVF
jgi:hypothetical protein